MEINVEEKSIVEALRTSPELKACVLEMLDITKGKGFEKLDLGDDAEDAVVDVMHKTGHTLLQEGLRKKGNWQNRKQGKIRTTVRMKKKL